MTDVALERRSCPCTHIVALAEKTAGDIKLLSEKTAGEIKLISSETSHMGDALRVEIRNTLEDFQEMRVSMRECLEDTKVASDRLSDGVRRFEGLEATVAKMHTDAADARAAYKEHSMAKIKQRQDEEASYRQTIRERIKYLVYWLCGLTLFLLVSHTLEFVEFLKKVVLR